MESVAGRIDEERMGVIGVVWRRPQPIHPMSHPNLLHPDLSTPPQPPPSVEGVTRRMRHGWEPG